ncbi:MAG TPA: penicillin acylase family protein [Solirubrobacteraceae bacterium]|nr:penicillin acylase family protein [Solirubrobacteraceae bacterium]
MTRGRSYLIGLGLAFALAAPAHAYDVTITRTAHGIPHVFARDLASLGYGFGYAFAEDNICTIAESYVTVNAQRSRYFGPDRSWRFESNGTAPNNLNSDFFYQRVNDSRVIERLLAEPPPRGPLPEIKEGVKGYVDGYNAYLRNTGVGKIPDPRCRGAAWVRPITEIDAYRRFYQLASLASQGVAVDGIGGAQPATGGSPPGASEFAEAFAQLRDIGSNAYGIGGEQTHDGHGIVLGNPHFPWQGAERLYQSHLTIPGRVDVAGASLYGVPLVLIGSTQGMAWSHTVSTARRFTLYEEKLASGSPTTYLNDGRPEAMKAERVTIKVRDASGALVDRTRTLYSTRHGPVVTSLLGIPLPWGGTTAFTMADANASNFRYLNHFYEVNQAQSVRRLDEIERRYQGIPWVNTIAADAAGEAYYADIGSVPHLTNDKASQCNTPLGQGTFSALGVAILDGARSACDWGSDADAVVPGILGPSKMPSLFRRDYVHNGNDSYWLSNPRARLEGYPRIIGDERTVRSLRTRIGILMAEGRRFSVRDMQDTVFNNRHFGGELLAGELAAYCRANPTLQSSSGQPVDVRAACPVLERWDRRDDLDSRGAVLFRRWATRALASVGGVVSNPATFRQPFDPEDPVNTPRGLNTSNPQVGQALADAVNDLRSSRIPLDARLREYQSERRGNQAIPIHGGPGGHGVFNAIAAAWVPGKGYPDVNHGSSFVMVARPDGRCSDMRTLVTYSQSENPESPYSGDQTRMYSRKQWNDVPFCAHELAAAPLARVREIGCLTGDGLRSARVSRRGRRGLQLAFRPVLAAPATAEVVRIAGPRGLLRRAVTVRRSRASRRLYVAGLPDGWYVARISARALNRKLDRREVGFRVVRGRVLLQPRHHLRERCGLLRGATLGAPVFGSRLRARVRVGARSVIALEVVRGRRVVARIRRTAPAGATRILSLNASRLARGARHRVLVRVTAPGRRGSATLYATRR